MCERFKADEVNNKEVLWKNTAMSDGRFRNMLRSDVTVNK